jgi:hypothetical protein
MSRIRATVFCNGLATQSVSQISLKWRDVVHLSVSSFGVNRYSTSHRFPHQTTSYSRPPRLEQHTWAPSTAYRHVKKAPPRCDHTFSSNTWRSYQTNCHTFTAFRDTWYPYTKQMIKKSHLFITHVTLLPSKWSQKHAFLGHMWPFNHANCHQKCTFSSHMLPFYRTNDHKFTAVRQTWNPYTRQIITNRQIITSSQLFVTHDTLIPGITKARLLRTHVALQPRKLSPKVHLLVTHVTLIPHKWSQIHSCSSNMKPLYQANNHKPTNYHKFTALRDTLYPYTRQVITQPHLFVTHMTLISFAHFLFIPYSMATQNWRLWHFFDLYPVAWSPKTDIFGTFYIFWTVLCLLGGLVWFGATGEIWRYLNVKSGWNCWREMGQT